MRILVVYDNTSHLQSIQQCSVLSFDNRYLAAGLLKTPCYFIVMHACVLSRFCLVWFFVTLWTAAHHAPLSSWLSRQEYWSGLPWPPSGGLPNSGIEPTFLTSPMLASGFFTTNTTWKAPPYRHTSHRFPGGSAGKQSACNAGDLGSIPGLGRSPREEKDYPLRYSGLENSMDSLVHGVTKSRTQLNDFRFPIDYVSKFVQIRNSEISPYKAHSVI